MNHNLNSLSLRINEITRLEVIHSESKIGEFHHLQILKTAHLENWSETRGLPIAFLSQKKWLIEGLHLIFTNFNLVFDNYYFE